MLSCYGVLPKWMEPSNLGLNPPGPGTNSKSVLPLNCSFWYFGHGDIKVTNPNTRGICFIIILSMGGTPKIREHTNHVNVITTYNLILRSRPKKLVVLGP